MRSETKAMSYVVITSEELEIAARVLYKQEPRDKA
jgi:hypothetical protein